MTNYINEINIEWLAIGPAASLYFQLANGPSEYALYCRFIKYANSNRNFLFSPFKLDMMYYCCVRRFDKLSPVWYRDDEETRDEN